MQNYEAMIESMQAANARLESSDIGYAEANAHANLVGRMVKLTAIKAAQNKFLGDKTPIKFLKVDY